jgi:hypothetical protein
MSVNDLDPQQISEKSAVDEQLQFPEERLNFLGTNGNPEQNPGPATETSLPDDVDPAPVASLSPSPLKEEV